ncbi:hypothetical protein [Streptomyces sp. NPDC060194]|uniref:hypothetical protein n=1 Tax=Streptomyces sp. NPDC060194 TaxID=3347069 RepID=UPI0036513CCF
MTTNERHGLTEVPGQPGDSDRETREAREARAIHEAAGDQDRSGRAGRPGQAVDQERDGAPDRAPATPGSGLEAGPTAARTPSAGTDPVPGRRPDPADTTPDPRTTAPGSAPAGSDRDDARTTVLGTRTGTTTPPAPGHAPGAPGESATPGQGLRDGEKTPFTDGDHHHAPDRDAHRAPGSAAADVAKRDTSDTKGPTPGSDARHEGALVPSEAHDRLGGRLQHALGNFVDSPNESVTEAEDVLDEALNHLTRAIDERRTALRSAVKGEDTEQLRLALRQYRDMAERLLAL